MSGALLAYLHLLGVAVLFATLFGEWLLFRPDLPPAAQRRLVFTDLAYGAAATVVLVTGVLRLFVTGKGLAFYFDNLVFHAMGALFLLAALLSFYPTRRFIVRWRAQRAGVTAALEAAVATRIRRILHIEMVMLLLALLCAVLMARGIGWHIL